MALRETSELGHHIPHIFLASLRDVIKRGLRPLLVLCHTRVKYRAHSSCYRVDPRLSCPRGFYPGNYMPRSRSCISLRARSFLWARVMPSDGVAAFFWRPSCPRGYNPAVRCRPHGLVSNCSLLAHRSAFFLQTQIMPLSSALFLSIESHSSCMPALTVPFLPTGYCSALPAIKCRHHGLLFPVMVNKKLDVKH